MLWINSCTCFDSVAKNFDPPKLYSFQHDVSEVLLKGALEGVLEDCVSFVGVDLNACSAAVLRYVILQCEPEKFPLLNIQGTRVLHSFE